MKFKLLATAGLLALAAVSGPPSLIHQAYAQAAQSAPIPIPAAPTPVPRSGYFQGAGRENPEIGIGFPGSPNTQWPVLSQAPGQPSQIPQTSVGKPQDTAQQQPDSTLLTQQQPAADGVGVDSSGDWVRQLSDRFIQSYRPGAGIDQGSLFAEDARIIGPFADWGILRGPAGFREYRKRGSALFDVDPAKGGVRCVTAGTDPLRDKAIVHCLFPGMKFVPTGRSQDLELVSMISFGGGSDGKLITQLVSGWRGRGAEAILKQRAEELFERFKATATAVDTDFGGFYQEGEPVSGDRMRRL